MTQTETRRRVLAEGTLVTWEAAEGMVRGRVLFDNGRDDVEVSPADEDGEVFAMPVPVSRELLAVVPEKRTVSVVAVYECSQQWGGPEEGGWWYDAGTLVRMVKMLPNRYQARAYARRLNQRLRSRKIGPNEGRHAYSSVLSEGEYQAFVYEGVPPASFPETRPHYE